MPWVEAKYKEGPKFKMFLFRFAVGFKNISVDFTCKLPSWYKSMSTWENVITGKDI